MNETIIFTAGVITTVAIIGLTFLAVMKVINMKSVYRYETDELFDQQGYEEIIEEFQNAFDILKELSATDLPVSGNTIKKSKEKLVVLK